MTFEKAQDIVENVLFAAVCAILVSIAGLGVARIWLGAGTFDGAVPTIAIKAFFILMTAVVLPAATFVIWPRYR